MADERDYMRILLRYEKPDGSGDEESRWVRIHKNLNITDFLKQVEATGLYILNDEDGISSTLPPIDSGEFVRGEAYSIHSEDPRKTYIIMKAAAQFKPRR